MTRLCAIVRKITGNSRHLRLVAVETNTRQAEIPAPKTVEIVERDGAAYLLHLDQNGECIADTWHESVDAAKAQANFEFGIEDGDWKKIKTNWSQRSDARKYLG